MVADAALFTHVCHMSAVQDVQCAQMVACTVAACSDGWLCVVTTPDRFTESRPGQDMWTRAEADLCCTLGGMRWSNVLGPRRWPFKACEVRMQDPWRYERCTSRSSIVRVSFEEMPW